MLASLTGEERAELLRQARFERFATGEHIIDGDSDSRDVYFVVAGTVRVINYSLSGREVAFDDMGAGSFFGELAALDGAPRSAYVLSQGGEAVTARLTHEVFLDLIARKPNIGLAIARRLAVIVRQANERIMDLSTLGANNRVHAEILRQARVASLDGVSAEISPIPVHSDIASRVSTTRETVARVLSDLTRCGLVERKKSALVIPDVGRLVSLVENVRGN